MATPKVFQPALPMRGVTATGRTFTGQKKFQPALPMRGVTVAPWITETDVFLISTRTPHAGSDPKGVLGKRTRPISTRTPHAGSDPCRSSKYQGASIFQPALPMRGVTKYSHRNNLMVHISTRTPHAGSDARRVPCRGGDKRISTRTPHAGSDWALRTWGLTRSNFNPHSPCGE